MIGKIFTSKLPYYDISTSSIRFKNRPVLVISNADVKDYVVLPISTISRSENIDLNYDICVEPKNYPNLNLNKKSYIRTHKQTVVNRADIIKEISDLKNSYEDLYIEILSKREEFSNLVTSNALG